jgi:hypothetical protein
MNQQLNSWSQAKLVRGYFDALEQAAKEQVSVSNPELGALVAWIQDYAARIDPLANRSYRLK